ncbi:Box C/D snoRNA protein 1 [Echria macrotheca]|uniref:Box C/D snoRNA protein 1 n=1 Tax=Echria macrotheca TaxID=438768 RepID=A0AAJ0FFB6_9PEZI|nr:Box C/D snoRNA protein 1 [Echria macrotheca]
MASEVLTTLCSTCRIQPPKYKCPRCQARTCSAECSKKHKERAMCDGQRNPRAFMPINKLRTPAGIDHDYNFISSIERARERAEKNIIDTRKLLSEQELHPVDEDKRFRKVWYGDELRYIPTAVAAAQEQEEEGASTQDLPRVREPFDRQVRRRLRQLDIETIMMPRGMARQRENTTSWNARTGNINWQVEWLISGVEEAEHGSQLRILKKALEGKPLNKALAETLAWHRGQLDRKTREEAEGKESDEEGPPRKKRRHHGRRKTQEVIPSDAIQDSTSTAWIPTEYTLQYSLTGEWNQTSSAAFIPKTADEEAAVYATWQFFLLEPARPGAPTKGTVLIPISSTDSLADVLAKRTVVEFPTVYIFPPATSLPDGFSLGSIERRKRKAEVVEHGEVETAQQPPKKKQAIERDSRPPVRAGFRGGRGGGRGGRGVRFERRPAVSRPGPADDAEEGEINSDGDAVDVDVKAAIKAREALAVAVAADIPVANRPLKGLVAYGSDSE